MANVFLSSPRYRPTNDEQSEAAHGAIRSLASSGSHRVTVCILGSSLLAFGCNELLKIALNGRAKNRLP